ncbi:MAG: GNAT family N-acetyltransferase [Bacteroidales bacterium]|nr:GNAT family N-acetyltransferase [Bacteroidales bacterium]
METRIVTLREAGIGYEQLHAFLLEVFRGRLKQGLHFSLLDMDLAELSRLCDQAHCVLAAMKGDELVGTAMLTINEKRDERQGLLEHLAVSDRMQGQGLGTRLIGEILRIAREEGCACVFSDTATRARSSVRAHRKAGFRIVGLESYRGTNYYSYIFRYQIEKDCHWSSAIYCWSSFVGSAVKKSFKYARNGERRFLSRLWHKVFKR